MADRQSTQTTWMTALEMQFAALRFSRDILASGKPALDQHKNLHLNAGAYLSRADTFAWSSEIMCAVALAARGMPSDTSFADTHCQLPLASWWWFESPMPYISNAEPFSDGEAAIHALLVVRGTTEAGETGLLIQTFGLLEGKAPFATTGWAWRNGESLKDLEARADAMPMTTDQTYEDGSHKSDQTSVHVRYLTRFVSAASVWLTQKILSMSSGHVERHRRKQLAREHGLNVSDVKIVQLRRSESQPHSDTHTESHVDWSCRWIVSGHWRNQPYKEGHKLLYILPYVKGPDDKPLKTPTHTVFAVTR